MILSGSPWPWKLTHRSIIGLKRLVNSSKNKCPGSNWRVILMRIKQIEVFDKVSVTEIFVFLTRRGTATDFWFFGGFKRIFQEKKSHHVSMLTIGYLREEYEKFWFFIMCHDWLNVSGHSLLIQCCWFCWCLHILKALTPKTNGLKFKTLKNSFLESVSFLIAVVTRF